MINSHAATGVEMEIKLNKLIHYSNSTRAGITFFVFVKFNFNFLIIHVFFFFAVELGKV